MLSKTCELETNIQKSARQHTYQQNKKNTNATATAQDANRQGTVGVGEALISLNTSTSLSHQIESTSKSVDENPQKGDQRN